MTSLREKRPFSVDMEKDQLFELMQRFKPAGGGGGEKSSTG